MFYIQFKKVFLRGSFKYFYYLVFIVDENNNFSDMYLKKNLIEKKNIYDI